jgi:hypothetical protein
MLLTLENGEMKLFVSLSLPAEYDLKELPHIWTFALLWILIPALESTLRGL